MTITAALDRPAHILAPGTSRPMLQPLRFSAAPAFPRAGTVSCKAGATNHHRGARDDTETRPAAPPAVRHPPAAALGNIAPLQKPSAPVALPRTPSPEKQQQKQQQGPSYDTSSLDMAAGPPPAPLAAAWPSVCGLHAIPLPHQSPALARITARGAAGAFPPPPPPPPHGPHVVPTPGHELAEIVVGRVALAGLIGVEAVRAVTGMGLAQQAAAFGDNAALMALIVLAASLVAKTLPKGRGVEVRIVTALSLRAEKLVGRLAMVIWAAEVAAAAVGLL